MPSVTYSSRRTNFMYSIINYADYIQQTERQKLLNPPKELEEVQLLQTVTSKWWLYSSYWIKQLSSMISVALSDSESGSNLSYLNILPNLQKTYTLNILVNIRKYTCVKVESHIRNCIPQHRFHLFRHSILLLYKRKIIIANRATLFKW